MSDSLKKIVTVLDKSYCSEELCDVERDVYEAIQDSELGIEPDEYGFHPGAFKIVITYNPEG